MARKMKTRKSKRPRTAGSPSEPRSAERAYAAALLRISRNVNAIILSALEPLAAVWPAPRSDRRSAMSDSELRALWPSLDPSDVRRYAPWATGRDQVERIMVTVGRPIVGADLEDYVRASIRSARASDITATRSATPERSPGAFRIVQRSRAVAADPPVILGPNGLPMSQPPIPQVVTVETISAQFDWARINLGEYLKTETLSPIIDAAGNAINRHTAREIRRVLAIDLRESLPGIRPMIDSWRGANIRLIESGVLGPMDGVKLRPLLSDVSDMVEKAHAQGLRVEELAGQLRERFEISDRRAELIARDQVLKLNGQINQYRQRDAGVTEYVWRTVGDERVRPGHAALDGTTQNWDSPPEVSPGRFEHPGGDYQCRCRADPVLPAWMG